MSAIAFEKLTSWFTILNPFNDFASETHQVELRKDPLLGDTSIYNPSLKDKAKFFFGENDRELLKKIVDETAKNCIFCGENVRSRTARYPSDVLPEGRLRIGDAVLFANLFSVSAYHPVIALGNTHFLELRDFTAQLLTDGFTAAREFLRSVYGKDVSAAFAAVCSNYLLPAGASVVHPHMQMLVSPAAYSYHARMKDAELRYFRKHGTSFFDDLVSEEKDRKERYIGQQGLWHWVAAFSPMGSNEIMAIHEKESDFGALSDGELGDLSLGVTRVLLLYERLGHLSFNYTLFSVRKGAQSESSRCVFKIISRQNLYPNYRNDDYFLQKMLQSELIFNLPEELAGEMRNIF